MTHDTINKRLSALRALMNEKGYDAVIVPTGDYHMSEYTGDYFKCREYITGFTGSAGTAVIFRETESEEAGSLSGLWTDSRYFIQAEEQLEGSGLALFKMGQIGTPSIISHIINSLPDGGTVCCDGRVISFDTFAEWYDALGDAGITLDEECDLIGELWDSETGEHARPSLPCSKAFAYDINYCGRSRKDKLSWLRQKVRDLGAGAHLLTVLDDIAWLLNIRGSDVHCNPVILSYFLMDGDRCRLFVNEGALDEELRAELLADGVETADYKDIGEALRNLETDDLLLSATDTNSFLYGQVPDHVYIIEEVNPTQLAKAVKNETEIENARKAHLKDGVALTKFMCWIKSNTDVSEIEAQEKLYTLRSEQENFLGNSFDPIMAYGPHGAIVHYSATKDSNAELCSEGLLLCDTGGHYLEGTTDVTRTIALGPLTDDELKMSTAVLKGHIALASAVFPKGLNGGNLDYLAHAPLWKLGKDYGHGTGHGVGHLLSVHEGPNYIHWTRNGNTGTTPPFEPGMITSCEPGYYEDGKFGIRHESLLLCRTYHQTGDSISGSRETKAAGTMDLLCFEELTMVPFDLNAIDISQLNDEEKSFINSYHSVIYERISPYLDEHEKEWLKRATRKIQSPHSLCNQSQPVKSPIQL